MKFTYNEKKTLVSFIFLKFNLRVFKNFFIRYIRQIDLKRVKEISHKYLKADSKKVLSEEGNLYRGINQIGLPRNPTWVKTMYSRQGKWEERRVYRKTHQTCGRVSRESPYLIPARVWTSAKSAVSSSIRATLAPTGDAVEAREDAGPIVSRTLSRK